MFTGLVQAVGRVVGADPRPTGARLTIDTGAWGHHADTGDSISVSGCCLTVASVGASVAASVGGLVLAFDVVHETLRMTTLGAFKPGDGVNLEHAARADSLLGGHVVQGHVDGVATVESVAKVPEWRIRLRPPPSLMEFMVPKGSVGVDGVSLTLAAVDVAAGAFEVALIPTTLEKTTLGVLAAGGRCNIETDILARTAVHWMRHYGGR